MNPVPPSELFEPERYELTEAPRLVTALTGIEPAEVRVGLPVHAVFRKVADGVNLPYFAPARGGSTNRALGRRR